MGWKQWGEHWVGPYFPVDISAIFKFMWHLRRYIRYINVQSLKNWFQSTTMGKFHNFALLGNAADIKEVIWSSYICKNDKPQKQDYYQIIMEFF